MRNKILHSVTNRGRGFSTPEFLTNIDFHPSPETGATLALRKLLGLDQTVDDYHVIGMLAAIEGYPDVFREFQDGMRTYLLQNIITPAPVVTGGRFVTDVAGVPTLRLISTTVPVPEAVTLEYAGAGLAALVYGSRYELIRCRYVNGVVYPEWPVDLGVTGGLAMSWVATAKATIRARPPLFPYQKLALVLNVSDSKNEVLQRHGLLNNFHQAEDVQKKVAIVGLALGLSNPAVYG